MYRNRKRRKENPLTIKRANFYKNLGFKRIDLEYILFGVSYTPYVYTKKENIDKNEIVEIMFNYYKINCGEEKAKNNCKVVK